MELIDQNMPNIDLAAKRNPAPEYFSLQVETAHRFYRNLDLSLDEKDLFVVSGGRETTVPGYNINRRTFPFYSIEFVVGGSGWLKLGGKQVTLLPGTIFSYGPGLPHSISSSKNKPLEKFFVTFSGKRSLAIMEQCSFFGKILRTQNPPQILDTYKEIIYNGLKHTSKSDHICQTLLDLLILKIEDTALSPTEALSAAFETYQSCRQFIENNFRKLKSLAEIANNCHLDAAYLCRLFKRYGNQSPYQFLIKLQMNYAAELLLREGLIIKEVADKLNYDDQFHFSRCFKRVFGISPRKFLQLKS